MIRLGRLQLNIILLMCLLVLCGCGEMSSSAEVTPTVETGFKVTKAGTYDSVDMNAVITAIDTENKSITFLNHTTGRRYTLNYDGASCFYDKYGSSRVVDQFALGDVVDLTFLKAKKLINTLTESTSIFSYDSINDYSLNEDGSGMVIAGENYRFDNDRLFIFAKGNRIELMDVNECDVLTVKGYDHDIYSIVVNQGHGYLRLKGEDYFLGGCIEVGKIIRNVDENMLLTVPEGTYDVLISNERHEGKATVTIEADKETTLDVSEFVSVDNTQYGTLIFATTPQDAEVYIDGELVDTSGPYLTEYGIHQLIAKAEGYATTTQYIKVGQANATLDITLEKENEKSDSDTASVSPTPIVTTYVTSAVISADTSAYKVTIESPTDVEVYVDGSYVGIAPVSFPKVAGTHVVTLRKDGYTTRSYTITLDSLLQNETFSFSSLTESD